MNQTTLRIPRAIWSNHKLFFRAEKQGLEDFFVEYHNIFARHQMDIGMNTEFKVKLTPKDDKAFSSQNLPRPIHLGADLIVELAPMQNVGSSQFWKCQIALVSHFWTGKTQRKTTPPCGAREKNKAIADDYTKNYWSSQHFVKSSTTLGGKLSPLQARLLPGSALFAVGSSMVSGNVWYQLC